MTWIKDNMSTPQRSNSQSTGQLRKFAVTMASVLTLIAILLLYGRKESCVYLFLLSLVFLLFGMLAPMRLKPIYKLWMAMSNIIGWFVTKLILCALFYLVLTPVSLLARLFGKNFLELEINPDANTYWVLRKNSQPEKTDYEKQF